MSEILFFNASQVEEYLPVEQLVKGVETSFVYFTSKQEGVSQPERLFLPVTDQNFFLVKPSISLPHKSLAAKLLTYYPENEKKHGLPSHNAVVTVFDSETGRLEGVMDGSAVTDLRTAAATAVAIKHLSNVSEPILVVIGTGHQAASHIQLLKKIMNFKEVRVFGRSKEKCEIFAKKHESIAYDSIENAVKNADIIITVTFSKVPLIQNDWIKPGVLINIVGAVLPDTREVDDKTMLTSQIFTDSIETSYKKAGDIVQTKCKIDAELGSVINGTASVDFSKTRVFKSNGLALQDLIAGRIVIDNFLEKNKK